MNSPNYSTSSTSSRSFSNNSTNNPVENSFDAIKQTCQNLFSSFTEKLATDLAAFDAATPANHRPQPAPPPPSNNSINNNYSNNNVFNQPQRSPKPYNSSNSESHRNSSSNSSHFSVGLSPTTRQPQNNNDNIFRYDRDDSTAPQPGPSGHTTIHPSMSNHTVSSSTGSSFEDLGAIGGTPINSATNAVTTSNGVIEDITSNSSDITDRDHYHFVQRQPSNQTHERSISPPSTSTKYRRVTSTSTNLPIQTVEHADTRALNSIARSQSDAFIIENSHTRRSFDDDFSRRTLRRRSNLCCTTCRHKVTELNRVIQNFRQDLDSLTNLSDTERKNKMEQFLQTLERTYSYDSIGENLRHVAPPSRLDIIDDPTIQSVPILDDTQLSPYSGDIDEGIYVYPSFRYMFDEHSNNLSNGGINGVNNGKTL